MFSSSRPLSNQTSSEALSSPEKPPSTRLRFKVGDRVECCVDSLPQTNGGSKPLWMPGTVTRCWYRESAWYPKVWAPYQVVLDASETDADGKLVYTPGSADGKLIYTPNDNDLSVRRLVGKLLLCDSSDNRPHADANPIGPKKADQALPPGTEIFVENYGLGRYVSFKVRCPPTQIHAAHLSYGPLDIAGG